MTVRRFSGWGKLCASCGAITEWVCPHCMVPLCEWCEEHECTRKKVGNQTEDESV